MKVRHSKRKGHMSTSDILVTPSMDTLNVDDGTEEDGKKPKERRSLGGKVEKKKQGNRKWSILDLFGLGSAKKNKGPTESKSKNKNCKEEIKVKNNGESTQIIDGVEYSTNEAGRTPKQSRKLRLSASKLSDLVKMKENVSSKIVDSQGATMPMRKSAKRTPLMDLVRSASSSAKVVDSNMLVKEKVMYNVKSNRDATFNVLNESDVPQILIQSPNSNKDKSRTRSLTSDVNVNSEVAKLRKQQNQSDLTSNKVSIAKCLINEAQGHVLNQTPLKRQILSTPSSACSEKLHRVPSYKYSLRSAGSTPPKPPRPTRKSVPRHNLQDINAKLNESSSVPLENTEGIHRSTSRKPPIRKPPRRSLPKRECAQSICDTANISSVSLEILAKSKNPCKNEIVTTPVFAKSKRDSFKASQKSPLNSADFHGISLCRRNDSNVSLPSKRRRNSLSESCNSPVMSPKRGKSKLMEKNPEPMTPPAKKRRSASFSRGRSHSLSRSRSLSSSRLRRNQHQQPRVNDYLGSTPRIKRRILVTRSRSMTTGRSSELSVPKRFQSPLLTPFTAVMKEMEEETLGKKKKKEKTLADVMKKQLSGTSHTCGEQMKKKVTPQKPPRKKLSLKSTKLEVQIPLVNTSSERHSMGEPESSSSSSEEKTDKKPPPASGSKPPLRKKPSFISDGVTKVRRRFSKPGDVKKIMESLKANDSGDSLSVNAMNAGHTPKPPRRSRVNSERVIL